MRSLVAALTSIFFLGSGVALAQETAKRCAKLEVSSSAKAPAGSQRFSASKILDLTLSVLFPAGSAGDHLIELRVLTPDGQLYRSLAVAVTNREEENLTRSVTGYPHPLPLQPLAPVARGTVAYAAATASLPVAGTDIVSAGLYGRWRVEAYLDGAEQRCAQAAFTLNP